MRLARHRLPMSREPLPQRSHRQQPVENPNSPSTGARGEGEGPGKRLRLRSELNFTEKALWPNVFKGRPWSEMVKAGPNPQPGRN